MKAIARRRPSVPERGQVGSPTMSGTVSKPPSTMAMQQAFRKSASDTGAKAGSPSRSSDTVTPDRGFRPRLDILMTPKLD